MATCVALIIGDGGVFSLNLRLTLLDWHFHPDYNFLFVLRNKPTQLMGNYFNPSYIILNTF